METKVARDRLSALLMNTDEQHHLKVCIALDYEEGFGLSTNDMPQIEEIWQHPTEGIIMLKMAGEQEPIELEQLQDYEEVLYDIYKDVERQINMNYDGN